MINFCVGLIFYVSLYFVSVLGDETKYLCILCELSSVLFIVFKHV